AVRLNRLLGEPAAVGLSVEELVLVSRDHHFVRRAGVVVSRDEDHGLVVLLLQLRLRELHEGPQLVLEAGRVEAGVAVFDVGDLVWYRLGRRHGAAVLTLLCRISLEPDSCVRRTEDVFARWGARVLLIAKFVPGLNTVAAPLAGVARMPPGRFVRHDAGGALLWAGAYAGLGYAFSPQLGGLVAALAGLGRGAVWVVAATVAAYVTWKYAERRRFLRGLRVARITPAELRARLEGDGYSVLFGDH